MKSDAKKRKELFYEWCEVTTCAGVVDWHLARTYQTKIFWTIFLSVGLGLTIWQTAIVIVGFMTDNHFHTTLTMKSDPIPFPNVTLCNMNRINRHLLDEFENETTMLSYALMPAAINYLRPFDGFSRVEKFEELDKLWIKFKTRFNISDIKSLFQIFGPSCNEVFFECRWRLTPFNCCEFATDMVTAYGRCWTLRPPTKDSQTSAFQLLAGVYHGLQLVLNPNLDQYVKGLVYNNIIEEGFFIDIGFIQQGYMSNFKVLQPGTHSWIAMTATKQTVKTSSFQIYTPNCSLFQKFQYLTAEYSQLNCYEECSLVIIYRICHCLTMSTTRPEYKICSPFEMQNCLRDYSRWMSELNLVQECISKCFQPCDPYWTVETSQTSTKFIGQHVNDQLQKILVTENNTIDSNIGKLSEENVNTKICLDVYFETLNYVEVQLEETNPILAFIGNVGGQLSLWLGISIVTVLQALYYIIACLAKKNCSEIVVKSIVRWIQLLTNDEFTIVSYPGNENTNMWNDLNNGTVDVFAWWYRPTEECISNFPVIPSLTSFPYKITR